MNCYGCTHYTHHLEFCTRTIYVSAETFEEAARIFEEKKYWSWKLIKVELIGMSIDKNSGSILTSTQEA